MLREGPGARFLAASSSVLRLRRARDEGRPGRELAQVGRARLLVADGLGLLPPGADGARLLSQVVSEGYERQSAVVTTNLESSRWGQTFGDERMAAAAIDRVARNGRLLRFRGRSYRVRHALMLCHIAFAVMRDGVPYDPARPGRDQSKHSISGSQGTTKNGCESVEQISL